MILPYRVNGFERSVNGCCDLDEMHSNYDIQSLLVSCSSNYTHAWLCDLGWC